MRTAAFTLILAALIPSLTFAQSRPTDKVSQGIEWFSLANNIKVHKRLSILAEGQFRFAGDFEPMQFQFRTGTDIHVTKNLSIMPIGYVYTWNPTYGKQPAKYVNNEHRFYQQVFFKHQVGKVFLSHRGRIEERNIQVHTTQPDGEVIDQGYDLRATRFRYRLMANIPLKGKEIAPKQLFVSVYDEVFAEWGKPVIHHWDQNRFFAGLGYQTSKKFMITGGFLYHMLVKLNGVQQENNFGVQINATYNIDLTKQN